MIGGGIVGVASAAYLAEAGLSVALFEQSELAAGASGRNSGAIQRPGDGSLATLQERSLHLYRELAASDDELSLADEPAGLLIVSPDQQALASLTARMSIEHPGLGARLVPAGDPYLRESGLAADVGACRLDDAYPVAPAVTTLAFARRAARAGVSITLGERAVPEVAGRTVVGVRLASGNLTLAGAGLIAAGPSTPSLVPGWAIQPPIRSSWGVVVATTLPSPPRPVLEELGIEAHGGPVDMLFSLVSSGGASSVGSTFLPERPDAGALAGSILERAARFVPSLGAAPREGIRVCPRPVSFDGRPLIGRVPAFERLFVCAGHGPWGISTGAASARLVADLVLAELTLDPAEVPPAFDPARWPGR